MSQTEIWTERLLLRAAERRDLLFFAKWLSDPESMKFWSCPLLHTTIEETEKYLDRMLTSGYNGIMEFSVCLLPPSDTGATVTMDTHDGSSDGEDTESVVIGKAGLWDGKEIAYIFDREHWGKGYAFEAVDAILKHVWALENGAPEVVVADVHPDNKASLRLLLKLGFVQVGSAKNTWKTHLGWRDSVYLEARKPAEEETAES